MDDFKNDDKDINKNQNKYNGDLNDIFGKPNDINKKSNFNGFSQKTYNNQDSMYSAPKTDNIYAPQQFKQIKKESNFIKIFISIFVAIILFASGFLLAYSVVPSEEEKLVRWIKSISENKFYDVDNDGTDFLEVIGNSMVSSLDKFSSFYMPEGMKALMNESQGIFNDTGMVIMPFSNMLIRKDDKKNTVDDPRLAQIENGQISNPTIIAKVYGNSPAYLAGAKVGDSIIKVNDEDVSGKTSQYISMLIAKTYSENTEEAIIFTVKREGFVKSIELAIKQEEYKPVFSYYYTAEEIGLSLPADAAYISFEEFSNGAETQFAENLQKFKNQGKRQLILDMRTNFGGSMAVLQKMASHLIGDNNNYNKYLIINSINKKNQIRAWETTESKYNEYNFSNIIVLANQYSASATEVLICAMKDYGTIGSLVGETTYGKAVMQTLQTYKNYGIYLTTDLLLSPKGGVTYNEKGFNPDFKVGYNISGSFKTDNQFLKAVELLKQSGSEL